MPLSNRQEEDLNRSILQYFQDHSYSEAFEAFQRTTNLQPTESPSRLMERKWTSIIRLQNKIMNLESQIKTLQQDLEHAGGPRGKKQTTAALPREPAKCSITGHRQPITCVHFHQTYGVVASTGDDAQIRITDADTGKVERTFKGHTDAVSDLRFNPAGDVLASCSADLSVKLWDFDSSFTCIRTLHGHDHTVSGVDFFPNGTQLVSCSRDKTVKIWDTSTGYCIKTFKGHEGWVRKVRVSPDGHYVASCSMDKTIRIWEASSGRCLHILRHEHVVESIAFSNAAADAILTKLVGGDSSSQNGNSHSHTRSTQGEEEREGEGVGVGGRHLVSCSRDKTIRVWDVHTGECVLTLTGHENWVRVVLFHPCGQFILSGSDDKSIRVWDLKKNGRCCHTIANAHSPFVTTLDWNPSSSMLASGGVDNLVKIWQCR